jgi:hypothetical protein
MRLGTLSTGIACRVIHPSSWSCVSSVVAGSSCHPAMYPHNAGLTILVRPSTMMADLPRLGRF